ncbi:MAG: TonB-dependent receptor [Hyphomicrobiaceae bacterium]|nr:TonB-dependent receptor [Hyphomicrobiaceae bacterium]
MSRARLSILLAATAVHSISPASAQQAPAGAAVSLPPVEVTQPGSSATPVRKKPRPATAVAAEPAPAPDQPASAPPEPAETLPGTLIVVDDAFVPVTVATSRDVLAEGGATIADALERRPGVASSTFAPGSSRPIVRGLDTYRVRVQENGIGAHDVSALSEDHAVPIDPFAADKVEVIRGPATLRYGSQAIGGVVAVENNRVPSAVPRGGISAEVKGDLSSVDEGRTGAFKATAGAAGVVVHADGFRRRSEDYDTPRGEQFNSFVEADGGAAGVALVGTDGFIGVAVSRYESLYGIPGEEAGELRPRIDLEQNKVLARGEWRVGGIGVEAVRFWFGASEYAHNEVVDEGDGDEIGQRYTNDEVEGRFEAQHATLVTSLGALRGAVGAQFVDRQSRGQSFEGDSLLQPAETRSIAAFWFEELDVTSTVTLQAAARIEQTDVEGAARLSPLDAGAPVTGIERSFTPVGASLGALWKLPAGSVVSLNGQYVERAPDAAELYSGGIHEATGTFEIGNPGLELEKAVTIELGWRHATGPFRFDATAFATRYDGFIFKALTGVACEGTLASCGNVGPGAEETLDQVLFGQVDAYFHGVELTGQYDVAALWNGVWGIEAQYDFVRARFAEGGNVPRIPPHRLGGGLYYRDAAWLARAGVLHAFDQNEFAASEIATPGYTLVSAEASYTTKLPAVGGIGQELTIGLKGENLADDEVLNHASFKRREDVLLPGASVRLFGSLKLN